jgi:hypothetical protein
MSHPKIERTTMRELTEAQIDRLWTCYSSYASARREDFVHELQAATDIYMFLDPASGELLGFHALRELMVDCGGYRCAVLYTSYADIHPASRGHNLLQRVAVMRLLWLKLRHPLRPVYFVYTASTYMSYLLLPHNVAEYWPGPRDPPPPRVRALLDEVMQALERDGWDPAAGVIHRHGRLRYRVGVVADDPRLLTVPEIAFYAQLNPRQAEGDTLVCACPLSLRNLWSVLRTMVDRWWRRRRLAVGAPEDEAGGGRMS